MHGQGAASRAYTDALREELVVSGQFLRDLPIFDVEGLMEVVTMLTEPWWHVSLDLSQRRSVVRRISHRIHHRHFATRSVIAGAAVAARSAGDDSTVRQWQQNVLSCAMAYSSSFPEAVRMATSDALGLARKEVDGVSSRHPYELAVIYDSLVLTSAYGLLHTLRAKPDSHTLRVASHILSHAALVSDRLR
jgi:hypothetical protein